MTEDINIVQKQVDAMSDAQFIDMNIDNMKTDFKEAGAAIEAEMKPFVTRFEQIRDRLKTQDGR